MKYDYNVYYRQNCIVPLVITAFLSLLIIINLIALKRGKIYSKEWMSTLTGTGVFALLIIINIVPLARGGINLLDEKENNGIEIHGKIEAKEELPFVTGYKYGTENNGGNGEAITINQTKYYLTTYGNLRVGDEVIAYVLPKSHLVLEIQRKDGQVIVEYPAEEND